MTSLKDFLLFCSGVDINTLKKCPTDENKFVGIGATVLFTGILAFISSSYALYTVFDSTIIAIAFGMVWGTMIFNLDRYIVGSMKNRGSFFSDMVIATPRFLMAILLALVIAKPLELKIFEKEINSELITMEQELFKTQEDILKTRFSDQIEEKRKQIETLKSELFSKAEVRDQLALMAIQEADGTGGSGEKNLGPIYRAKKADADNANVEYEGVKTMNMPMIQNLESEVAELESTVSSEIKALERSDIGGIAARMEALTRLGERHGTIFMASIFIMLLFISIETAPLFVKLIASRSPYDHLLFEEEFQFEMASLEKTTIMRNEVENKLTFNSAMGKEKLSARITAEKELIDAALKHKVEELKKQPVKWNELFIKKSIVD